MDFNESESSPIDSDDSQPEGNTASEAPSADDDNNSPEPSPSEVTEVYTSSETNLGIPDDSELLSSVSIADRGTILDLNVQLGISHDRSNDLDVFLISPDGTSVKLFALLGGNGNNLENLTLDDDASHPISAAPNPNLTTFRPEEELGLFEGLPLSGIWTLEIRDTRKKKIGTLDHWSLAFTYLNS